MMSLTVIFLSIFLLFALGDAFAAADVPFEQNYEKLWGFDHITLFNQSRDVQLSLDQRSGSGFQSFQKYGSGFFSMRIKTPSKDSTHIITTYYMNSTISDTRDEIDFEFIFKNNNHILHTNLLINGKGGRAQEFLLWFDPSVDFHKYSLLWNEHQLVWFVDDIPIRVFKNNTKIGGTYPTQPTKIVATLWSDPYWLSAGTPIHWGDAPFLANYQGFGIDGCVTLSISSDPRCYSSHYWWNQEKYWQLDPTLRQQYEVVRKKVMIYDYCASTPTIPECQN